MRLNVRRAWPVALCFAVAFALAFARAIDERIFSDEQLFLGGAGLMARGRGLIYRDFFYNHVPTHALVLAGLFKLTGHWTLVARTFDALCGAGLVTLIFAATRAALAQDPVARVSNPWAGTAGQERHGSETRATGATSPAWRAAIAVAVAAAFLLNPMTADATGKAWNHDPAALASLGGFVLLAAGLARARPLWWVVASGACAGLAATTRLTFAPTLIGFPVLIALSPGHDLRGRARLLALWSLGGLVGAGPALYVWLQAPAAAYFDNFKFPGLTAKYHAKETSPRRLLFSAKLDFAWGTLKREPSYPILIAMTFAALAAALRPWRARATLEQARLLALATMVVAAAAAAFAPTPMFHQYLFGPLPFAALAIGWSAAACDLARRPIARWALLIAAGASAAFGASAYDGVARLFKPTSTWTPIMAHADAVRLRSLAPPKRKVMTFAPGIALEAGLPIYRELSIGRYGVRIGGFISKRVRQSVKVPMLAEAIAWFDTDPPGAVLLVTPQTPDERALAKAAIAHGYVKTGFGPNRVVYLPAGWQERAATAEAATTEPAADQER